MPKINDPLHPQHVLDLARRFGGVVGGIAESEGRIASVFRAAVSRARRERELADEDGRVALATRERELAEEADAATERERRRYAERVTRIEQAFHASQRIHAERAKAHRESVVGRTHAGILQTKKEREKEYARAKQERAGFEKVLGEDLADLERIEKRARSAVRGLWPWFRGAMAGRGMEPPPEADPARSPEELRGNLKERTEKLRSTVRWFSLRPLPAFFRFVPIWVLAPALALVGLWFQFFGGEWRSAWQWPDGIAAAAVLMWLATAALSARSVRRLARDLDAARKVASAASQSAADRVENLAARIRAEAREQSGSLSETLLSSDDEAQKMLERARRKLDAQHARMPGRARMLHGRVLEQIEKAHESAVAGARRRAEAAGRSRAEAERAAVAVAETERDAAMESLAAEWREQAVPLHKETASLAALAGERFPEWSAEVCEGWKPPETATAAVPFGQVRVSMEELAGALPVDPRFALPGPGEFDLPATIGLPEHGSLMFETGGEAPAEVAGALNNLILRLLSAFPPGRVGFTVIDPVGLGRDFAGLMHLADYEETLINSRIWTQSTQIEERLAELNEHIEKVIQMYLRNEFATIAEYNEKAGTIAERYRFLVVAGFPAGFSEVAAKRLLSIAASGARCGVFLLIQRDARMPGPDPALDEELLRVCQRVAALPEGFRWLDAPKGADVLSLAAPPPDDLATPFIHRLGRAGVDSNRVEVPFEQIAPPEGKWWSGETTEELRVAIGRTGARKLQQLALGKGTRQHALVAGKTGSGKSTLFHVIIANLALWCPPEQVEFYLVDFKKGVEFKCYGTHRLPHARVVAIESDREFGLSVLERVDAELKRRGELFRALGVQDIAGYKRAGGAEPMPRTLLLIDEFQEFFTVDDPVAQDASLLLDRIVRQGRAFGIHVILGSQTLGGAYTLARATLGQMVVRIALQCNEADALLIMDEDNPAPRLLTRPGEGIYNDNAGAVEANSPFQTVWLGDEERDALLDRVAAFAAQRGCKSEGPIVFEGNAPADVRDNAELAAALAKPAAKRPPIVRAWLGAPNSIKGPTHVSFQRQSGSHLLVVGQGEERNRILLGVALASLAAQFPQNDARFIVLDPAPPDRHGFLARVAGAARQEVQIATPHDLDAVTTGLAEELAARTEPGAADKRPEIFVIVRELQRFRKLRQEDEFKFSMDDDDSTGAPAPSKVFQDLITEGPASGMHLLVSIDTWNNVSRWIQRRALGDFENRVLFQMSANDSANLVDSAVASGLGLHRALLHNDALGTSETFRPYAEPDPDWPQAGVVVSA
jgi:DNA segregation ATPase FtsK/SpoIIIE-like protein